MQIGLLELELTALCEEFNAFCKHKWEVVLVEEAAGQQQYWPPATGWLSLLGMLQHP